jgi:hypothetical protein
LGISEDIYTDGKESGWSLDRTNFPLRTLRELQQRPFWFFIKYVSMYTGRNLTKPQDILAAFEGISWLLERYMQAPSLLAYRPLISIWLFFGHRWTRSVAGDHKQLPVRRTHAPKMVWAIVRASRRMSPLEETSSKLGMVWMDGRESGIPARDDQRLFAGRPRVAQVPHVDSVAYSRRDGPYTTSLGNFIPRFR